jgi:cell division protein FtsW
MHGSLNRYDNSPPSYTDRIVRNRFGGTTMQNHRSTVQYSAPRLAETPPPPERGRGSLDIPMLVLTLLLLIVGVITVLSASYARAYYSTSETGGNAWYYFLRQGVFALAGVCAMLVCARIPIAFYRRMAPLLYVISIVCLVLVPLIGVESGGAKRWLSLGFTTFQPSEIAKLSVVLLFGHMICGFREKMQTVRYGLLPFLLLLVLVIGLLVLEPHLSASVIILAVGAIMIFLGGAKLWWFLGGAAGAVAAGTLFITKFAYASSRITSWLDPFSDTSGKGYQIIQSLYAIGSGGLFGLGLGQSRQKYLYLPEEHNDFIFSVLCEELGFVGAALVLALFALLILRGYWLAMHARNRYSALICAGITSLLAVQVLLNVAVVTNLVPCTGISLPFFSYGGTALLIQLAEIGIILSVSREIPGA